MANRKNCLTLQTRVATNRERLVLEPAIPLVDSPATPPLLTGSATRATFPTPIVKHSGDRFANLRRAFPRHPRRGLEGFAFFKGLSGQARIRPEL